MSSITYVKTPGGEEFAILPRRDLEALSAALKHTKALADHRSGRDPGLSAKKMRALLAAPTPLAFWRRERGLTQVALARRAGVTQNYLSDLETGKREGRVAHWRALSKALDLPLEDLLSD